MYIFLNLGKTSCSLSDILVLLPKYSYKIKTCIKSKRGFPGGAMVKNLLANAGDIRDADLIPGSGRSPGEGHGNPLQCSCLENLMDRGAQRASLHRAAELDITEVI